MRIISHSISIKQPVVSKKFRTSTTDDSLRHLAFDNSLRANIICTVSGGKIIMANRAACRLLGYSKKELLTKTGSTVFDINNGGFKKMLKERTLDGQSEASVTAIKKNGKPISCRITSAVFIDENGVKKSITTIADLSRNILEQKGIDVKKEKIVADNIVLAKSKQKKIDSKKERIVADNIILAQAKSDARLAENNEWIKYIAKTSYDVMWDWDIATGEMYAGDSIEEVFGYKVQNNRMNFIDFCSCLLPEEKDAVEKKLFKTIASGNKSWKDSYMFKRYDGSVASTTTRASIVRDEEGKAIHLIGNIQDISKLQDMEKKLQQQTSPGNETSDIFELAAKVSYDGIWDWNLLTNEFFLGEGFEEIFGNALHEGGAMNSWSNYLHPDDKETVEKGLRNAIASVATHWEHAYRFVKTDGSIVNVFCRANIIRDAGGKACRMIGAVHDLSCQKELEDKLTREMNTHKKQLTIYEENFKLIFNSSSDILYDIDLINNKVVLSDTYEKELGYKIINHTTSAEELFSHIHPDDRGMFMQDYRRMLTSEDIEWKQSFRMVKADGSIANIESKSIVLRNTSGKAYRGIGYLLDISKQIILEEKLEQEIKLKEKQIADATEEAREMERSEIGKELHDNVNQLLGASKLYLDMAKRGGKDGEVFLSRSTEYTLTAIEEIRKLTKGLTTDIIKNLGLLQAIKNIIRDMMEVNPVKISLASDSFEENNVNNKFKLNIFRIVQEQLNNIIKYAKARKIIICLSQNKKSIILTISDNGIGFDTRKQQKGIGIANIKSRVESYKGIVDLVSQPGEGCVLTIKFPLPLRYLLNKFQYEIASS
jgi:PAS domain S-box-containing protein